MVHINAQTVHSSHDNDIIFEYDTYLSTRPHIPTLINLPTMLTLAKKNPLVVGK